MFGVALQFLFLLTSGVTLGQEHGAVRVVVLEGGDALFPVSMGMSAERLLFDWKKVGPGGGTLQEVFMYDAGIHYNNGLNGQSEQFKGRVSHFPAELKNGNAAIVIRKTTAADRGNYTCYFPRLQPPQTFYFELDVAAAPKPSVTILTATADRALLQCEVPGASLNTKAEWQSRDGNRLEAEEKRVPEEDHVFISLSVNVTRTDHYLCVVSQEDIKHRVSAQIYVFINEKESTNTEAIVAITLVAVIIVAVVAVVALLERRKCIKILHNKGSALKGKYMINMDDGLIIDVSKKRPQSVKGSALKGEYMINMDDGLIIDVSKKRPQSVEGSALKGREEINMGNGHVRFPLKEPLNSVSDSVKSDEKVCV